MAHHSHDEGNHDHDTDKKLCEVGDYKKKQKFGYGGGDSDGPTSLDGATFGGEYGVYFDCYKKGKKTYLRMFVDKNGDGEYSGENEFIAYSKKLNKHCAKYCEELDKGKLIVSYDVVKEYASGRKEKKQYEQAYKDGDDCYGFKEVKVDDGYGGYDYKKKYYKCKIDYAKVKVKSYFYKKVCKEYYDYDYGYGDGGDCKKYEDQKQKCNTVFKINGYDYLENFETALGFCA